jgi:uncharacterized protein YhaN
VNYKCKHGVYKNTMAKLNRDKKPLEKQLAKLDTKLDEVCSKLTNMFGVDCMGAP